MAIICPTITAYDPHDYRAQIERIETFSKRVHIDLMDGDFAPTKSPGLDQIWWPHELEADVHLMYQHPMEQLEQLLKLRPRMVVIHNEADVHHMHFVAELHKENILAGLAILQDTPIEHAYQIMHSFDHVLVFSGKLGFHGGTANLELLDKVKKIHEHHGEAEIGWDGGITDINARRLVEAGVDVLNVGGFVQRSENPQDAYDKLLEVIKK
jgi:ribulose-phosphate 3-epimerase